MTDQELGESATTGWTAADGQVDAVRCGPPLAGPRLRLRIVRFG